MRQSAHVYERALVNGKLERVVFLSWMIGSQHERKESRQLARKETRFPDNGLTNPRYKSKKLSQLPFFGGCFHDILISVG
jgi:hypothetical protein